MNEGTQELLKPSSESVRILRMRVEAPSGNRVFALASASMTLGRHPTNHIVVDDPNVSGVHLDVQVHADGITVRDLDTTNGTWLGEHRVYGARLSPGASLRIGASRVHLELAEEAAANTAPLPTAFGNLRGTSKAMGELFAMAIRVAPRDLSVLIQGETGTGKEEIARALHAASQRAQGPFVVIDATTIPDAIAESLLFGYEKGAFTGANERREGFFEAANGGTILIDEVGELSLMLQAKFLRVLERKEITRVGAQLPTPVNVRVIAATHRDLRLDIERGRFREDLYFRLSHVRLYAPPLRERPEDIANLARTFLGEVDATQSLTDDAIARLCSMPFPGNVRELRSTVQRASALATSTEITSEAFLGDATTRAPSEREVLDLRGTFAEAKDRAVERFEKAYLSFLMRRSKGNLSQGSRDSGLARHYLRDLLRKRELYNVTWDEDA
jgi:DNA-binding NtrC family response regulator